MAKRKVRVLIVDDEQVVCDFLRDELSEQGYFCTSVLNSNDALVKLRTHYFDIALVDIRLPGISGMELLRKIRSRYHNTAVIMITGINNIDTAVEAMRSGALDYVVKPFDIDRVSSSIGMVLENRKHLLAKEDSQITEEPFSPLDAIAYGVEANLDLHGDYLEMVTQRTIEIARWFNIPEVEIQNWVATRKKRRKINPSLNKLKRNPVAQSMQRIIGITREHLYIRKLGEPQN